AVVPDVSSLFEIGHGAGSGFAALTMVSRSDGRKNMALPNTRQAPSLRARSRSVRSDMVIPAFWSLATAADGEMASSRTVIATFPVVHAIHSLPASLGGAANIESAAKIGNR